MALLMCYGRPSFSSVLLALESFIFSLRQRSSLGSSLRLQSDKMAGQFKHRDSMAFKPGNGPFGNSCANTQLLLKAAVAANVKAAKLDRGSAAGVNDNQLTLLQEGQWLCSALPWQYVPDMLIHCASSQHPVLPVLFW